ncbi:hypothetical protein ACL02S_11795 [Nocardia sp. 004]|uniref:hypothetical protein n=1 Tax=Nocardia sp. 004 TaxID=3385978 RepID=UPI0039A12D82
MVVEHPIEDEVTQLARRVEKARGRLAYQFDPALTEALSEDELHAERDLAERIRTQEREQRWKEVQAAAAASDRARHTTEAIEKADMRDLLLARKAIAAQRRESSPHAKLASLYRHRSWSLRALAGVVAAGMLWSAVNVQHNIAPGGVTDPLYWFSYLLEGMISVCLIIIMIGTNKVAEWGVVDNRRQVAAAEIALLTLTIGLNTYPYLRESAWYDAAVHAIAPVMIGVALLIHDAASARYGLAIAKATEQIRELPDPAEQIRYRAPRYRTPAPLDAPHPQGDRETQQPPQDDVVPQADPMAEAGVAGAREHSAPMTAGEAEKKRAPAEKSRKPVLPETIEALDAMAAFEPRPAATVLSTSSGAGQAGKTDTAAGTGKQQTPAGQPIAPKPDSAAEGKDRVAPQSPVAAKTADAEKGQAKSPTSVSETATTAVLPEVGAVTRRLPTDTKGNTAKNGGKNGKSGSTSDAAEKQAAPTPDIYDTGSFRVADILEQELAELQAERRRARTSKQRSTSAAGQES